jgi:predicted TIM-barrel fold metal-dependent hydrolase
MVERMLAPSASPAPRESGVIDCDIHNTLPSPASLKPYLSSRWQRHQELIGARSPNGYVTAYPYPKGNPLAARVDAWPPSGLPPGADLAFMRRQHLDPQAITYGILNCLQGGGAQLNEEYGAALCRAVNDWQVAEWLELEPRLRASIVVPYENGEMAAEEIDRAAEHPGFVQVLLLVRTREPLGRRKYWRIYEAAERHGLPVGIHFGGIAGQATTSCGWPSYYIEDHTNMAQAFQAQVISLVCEGVFERFPGLQVVLIEGGFAWLPSLMWRLDKHWKRLREEVPHLKRLPSAYIREHMRVTTQPMEEPEQAGHLAQVIEHLGSDDLLLFATDYPHWDYDDPDRAFPVKLPAGLKRKIFSENARALYRFDRFDARR